MHPPCHHTIDNRGKRVINHDGAWEVTPNLYAQLVQSHVSAEVLCMH